MIIRYRFNGENILEFTEGVTDILLKYRQRYRKNEAGGILLGRVFAPSGNVNIEIATTPNRFDKAGTHYFDRSREAAQRIVNKAWKKSEGEQVYLGEWHSHPEPHASPSPRDRRMIRNMFHQTIMEVRFLFLVVIGTEENWVGIEDGTRLERLVCCEDRLPDDTFHSSSVAFPSCTSSPSLNVDTPTMKRRHSKEINNQTK